MGVLTIQTRCIVCNKFSVLEKKLVPFLPDTVYTLREVHRDCLENLIKRCIAEALASELKPKF